MALVSDEVVEAWMGEERKTFPRTRARADRIREEGTGSRLNDRLYARFDELIEAHDISLSSAVYTSVHYSVRSTLGGSSERLFVVVSPARIGVEASDGSGAGRLLSYVSGEGFSREIQQLRVDAAAGADMSEAFRSFASRFLLTEETVARMVSGKLSASYPDSVSLFENEVRVTQQKLSGETDCNNTKANALLLVDQCRMFGHLGVKVRAMVALPFAKPAAAAVWSAALREVVDDTPAARRPDPVVVTCERALAGLFGGCEDPDVEYDRLLDALARAGSDRLFAAFDPDFTG